MELRDMVPTIDREAYRFHKEHGGGWVGHQAECAANAARAEAYASEAGWQVEWSIDDDADNSWADDDAETLRRLRNGRYSTEVALLKDASGNVLEALGGIILDTNFFRDPYMRVIEAELALEAITRTLHDTPPTVRKVDAGLTILAA